MSSISGLRIVEFYEDSVILIAGATGFTGKVLLEKILRCLKPRKIYVLVRSKHNTDIQQRMKNLIAGSLFDKIRHSKLLNHVIPLEVDFEQDQLSFDESLQEYLANEVNVVFNLLACVNFYEPILSALHTNVEYARKLLELVSTFHHLKAMIHISTFYSNCDHDTIEEKIYEDTHFGGYQNVRRILAQLNPTESEALTPIILNNHPNTYTYSKKCAESMIQDTFGHLPIGIFRPPIVSSTYSEPVPGWYNNFNGPSGLLLAIYHGLVNAIPIDTRKKPFLAPVDYCVNGMLCCAVDVSRNHCLKSDPVQVYNFTDDYGIPNWGQVYARYVTGMPFLKRYIYGRLMMIISTSDLLCQFGYNLMRARATIIDWIYMAMGSKKRIRPMVEKIVKLARAQKFFGTNEWKMENRNMLRVIGDLTAREAELFPCNLRNVNWNEHLEGFFPGLLQYVVKPREERAKMNSI